MTQGKWIFLGVHITKVSFQKDHPKSSLLTMYENSFSLFKILGINLCEPYKIGFCYFFHIFE